MSSKEKKVKEIPEIGIGMLGYAFMGKAHTNGFKKMPYIFWPPPAIPKFVKICGRSEDKVAEEAARYGYENYCTDWHDLIDDNRIQVLVNIGPNNIHSEPCIAAAEARKHILCEKPLARNAEEAKKMLEAVKKAGVKHICGYNYRLVPALVLAKKLINAGKIGKIFHFRANYLQERMADPNVPLIWRFIKKNAGSGALGDYSHIIDLARWLCGEPGTVTAITKTFIKERPLPDNPARKGQVDVDDAFVCGIEFTNGAIGLLEGSRFCSGRKNYEYIEINGEKGSLYFNLENLNYLHVYLKEDEQDKVAGFRAVNVTESYHPYLKNWWPRGHIIGWEHTFVHQAYHLVEAVVNSKELSPWVANFEDGYKAMVICDAILKAAATGMKQDIKY